MQKSTAKNEHALDTLTRDILRSCRNQEDIDDWFSEVTQDSNNSAHTPHSPIRHVNRSPRTDPNSGNGDNTFNSDFDSAAWDDLPVSTEL